MFESVGYVKLGLGNGKDIIAVIGGDAYPLST